MRAQEEITKRQKALKKCAEKRDKRVGREVEDEDAAELTAGLWVMRVQR